MTEIEDLGHPADRNTLRADLLYLLRDAVDDPQALGDARAQDFDPAHAFADGSAPALRLGGDRWLRLEPSAAAVMARYVEALRPLGPGAFLFATDDVEVRRPPGDDGR